MSSIVFSTFLSIFSVSLISLIGAISLFFNWAKLEKSLIYLVSLSAGTLLGDAFFHLIPSSYKNLSENTQSFTPFPSKSDHLLGDTHRLMSTSSDEHDENGFSVDDVATRNKMMEKRLRKYDAAIQEMRAPELYGDKDAEITFTCWGSTYGAVREAVDTLRKNKTKANKYFFCVPATKRTANQIEQSNRAEPKSG